jgi:hypothetical protein
MAFPLLHSAAIPPPFPLEPPVDKPVKHSVHAIHGPTTRDPCPRPALDRSIGIRYQVLHRGPGASIRRVGMPSDNWTGFGICGNGKPTESSFGRAALRGPAAVRPPRWAPFVGRASGGIGSAVSAHPRRCALRRGGLEDGPCGGRRGAYQSVSPVLRNASAMGLRRR